MMQSNGAIDIYKKASGIEAPVLGDHTFIPSTYDDIGRFVTLRSKAMTVTWVSAKKQHYRQANVKSSKVS
jgi:hypothetical protein